jgi:5-methyltetrahydrofolate--homocysteine methyltransferase
MSQELLKDLYELVLDGQAKTIGDKVQETLDAGVAPGTILNEGLIAAMREIGRQFEEGEAFVPEMLIAARAMSAALVVLRPHLVSAGVEPVGKMAIGTVKGDLHDIGKSLVAMMCEGEGFEIMDLGVDVTAEQYLEAINNGAGIIAMSALLTTTMSYMQKVVDAVNEAGVRDKVKIMVGGAPLTQAYADQIGADAYASDASAAARMARELATA